MAHATALRILFVGASPGEYGPFHTVREFEAIHNLERSVPGEQFDLRLVWNPSPEDLPRLLLEYDPNIVHISSHGNEHGELLFTDQSGTVTHIDSDILLKLFRLSSESLRCVVLSACYSAHQAQQIAGRIDFVVGVDGRLSDTTAIHFTSAFYDAIGAGRTIATAFEFAQVALTLLDSSDESRFALFPRRGADLDHTFFSRATTATKPSRASGPSLDLTMRFLASVGRSIQIGEDNELRIPELVILASGQTITSSDVDLVERKAEKDTLAYIVHEGPIPQPVREQLGSLCVRGRPTVTLAADSMRAGLQDGNSRAIFAEHTRLGTQGINLFESTGAIANPALFFGRTELLNRVGSALGRGDATMITGIRKSGKSSFLHILRQSLSRRPVAWLDLQLLDRSDSHWHERAFARILITWDRWGIDNFNQQNWRVANPAKRVSKSDFVEHVDARWALQSRLYPHDGMLVVLDELERVFPDEATQADSFESFTGALRSLAQSTERPLTVIAADLRPEANRLNLLPNGHTNPWFQFFVEIPLAPLNLEETGSLVETIARRMGVSNVEHGFIAQLHAYSGGHAYLTRMLAASAWAERAHPDRLIRSDFERGLHKLEDHATLQRFYRENIWNPLTIAERGALLEASGSTALTRMWNRITGRRQDLEALASLRMLGLLSDSGITIGGLAKWLHQAELETAPTPGSLTREGVA